jgi:hypothetical protein
MLKLSICFGVGDIPGQGLPASTRQFIQAILEE